MSELPVRLADSMYSSPIRLADSDRIITDSGIGPEAFDRAKTDYFYRLGLKTREALKLHKAEGLWERAADGEREWGNVSEHCLVEAARAIEFAEIFGFNEELKADIVLAAVLHDVYKRRETEYVKANGITWDSFVYSDEQSTKLLESAGFSPRVVRLASSVGFSSLEETKEILEKPDLKDDDVAYLCMHYIDDFTAGSDWAEPAQIANGQKRNSIDNRMDKNEANERYAVLNEAGREHFEGMTTFEFQREVAYATENRLVELLEAKTGTVVEPKDLPVFIDNEIRARIVSRAQATPKG
jgi:hypothetical protein